MNPARHGRPLLPIFRLNCRNAEACEVKIRSELTTVPKGSYCVRDGAAKLAEDEGVSAEVHSRRHKRVRMWIAAALERKGMRSPTIMEIAKWNSADFEVGYSYASVNMSETHNAHMFKLWIRRRTDRRTVWDGTLWTPQTRRRTIGPLLEGMITELLRGFPRGGWSEPTAN